MWLGTGPQIDSLGHLGEHGMFYNCNKGKDFAAMTGMTKLGEKIPSLVGRGVLVDMAAYLGVKTLAPGQVVLSCANQGSCAPAEGHLQER